MDEIDDFILNVKKQYWGEGSDNNGDISKIEILRKNEIPGEESEEFMNYFD